MRVRNVGTGQERTTTTSADGSYAIPELPIGTYAVTITQSGFQTSVASNVEVNVATERRVDAQLKTGEVAVKVEVAGDLLPQVETTSARTGRHADQRHHQGYSGQRARLHETDLPESRVSRVRRTRFPILPDRLERFR